jgi:2-oxoglutarate dehydrogenase E2 component (dihydrolipoamide succinyltransferase)
MATKVTMPIMGEGVTDATVTKWLKQVGDEVKEYDPLVEVNTDKVDTEVPSPVSGTVLKIVPEEGAVVEVEGVLAWIGEPGEEIPEDGGAPAKPKAEPKQEPKPAAPAPQPVPATPTPAPVPPLPAAAAPAQRTPAAAPRGPATVSPLVARIAAEHSVDLARVPGTGAGGRITKQDVLNYVQSGGAAAPAPAARAGNGAAVLPKFDGENMATFLSPVVKRLAQEHNLDVSRIQGSGQGGRITKQDIEALIAAGGQAPMPVAPAPAARPQFPPAFPDAIPGEVMKLNPVRKSIAEHMVRSKHTSPHVTTIMEADMSAVFAHRAANKAAYAEQGVKLTITPYFVAAIAAACQAYPIVNSSWSDEGVAVHGQVNVGMATALEPDGLIVPVIKNAGAMNLMQIAQTVKDLSTRARAKQLKPDDVQGGTITITNHGTSGSLFATPIINQPQCAILGTGAIEKRVKVIDDALAIRPMVYLGLTFDHRILDGAVADYFLGTVKYTLESWA